MHVESYPELLDVITKTKQYLQHEDKSLLIWRRNDEADPLSIDLSFEPELREATVESFLEPNVCTLCERRIGYKPGQFGREQGKAPFLILIHNSFILDRGRFFEDVKVNEIFVNMIRAGLGRPPHDFVVREVLRCYFGAEDEGNGDYLQNCRKHLAEDIEGYKVKGIVIIGQAAPLIFGSDKRVLEGLTGSIKPLFGTPAMVMPGPARIVYMQKKGFAPEKIVAEKRAILGYLENFRREVMGV